MKAETIGAGVVVAASLVAAVMIGSLLAASGPLSSTTVTTTTTGTSTLGNGLELRISVATAGRSFSVNITEFNTRPFQNNVSAAHDWAVVDPSLGYCGTQDLPIGVELFSGHVTSGNLSQAKELMVFPPLACPLFLRLVTGYLFEANGFHALILPTSNYSSSQYLPISRLIQVNGVYDSGGGKATLSPGVYTMVGADEWGAITLAYIRIQ